MLIFKPLNMTTILLFKLRLDGVIELFKLGAAKILMSMCKIHHGHG